MVIFQKNKKYSGYKISKNVFLNLECESNRHFWDDDLFSLSENAWSPKNCVGKPTQGGQNEPLF